MNKILYSILVILVISYASLAKTPLSDNISRFLNNSLVRLLLITLIAYIAIHDIKVAIIVSIALVITLNLLTSYEMSETFRNSNMFQHNRYSNPIPLNYTEQKPLDMKAPNNNDVCDPVDYSDYPNEHRYYGGEGCEALAGQTMEFNY